MPFAVCIALFGKTNLPLETIAILCFTKVGNGLLRALDSFRISVAIWTDAGIFDPFPISE